jgi:hypothetical protein
VDDKEKLAKWILPYSELNVQAEFEKETYRLSLLGKNSSEKEMELNYLFPSVYQDIKTILSK